MLYKMDIKLITSTAGWQYCILTYQKNLHFDQYFCCHNDQVEVCDVILIFFLILNPYLFASFALCIASCYFTFDQQRSLLQMLSSVTNIYSVFSFVYICTGHHFVLDQDILTMICLNTHWLYMETVPIVVWRYLCKFKYRNS